MKLRIYTAVITLMVLISSVAHGQGVKTGSLKKADSAKMDYRKYLKAALQTADTIKLNKVEQILNEWRSGLSSVMRDAASKPDQKKQRIAALTEIRDKKLLTVVTEKQLQYLYPAKGWEVHIREKNDRLKRKTNTPMPPKGRYIY